MVRDETVGSPETRRRSGEASDGVTFDQCCTARLKLANSSNAQVSIVFDASASDELLHEARKLMPT